MLHAPTILPPLVSGWSPVRLSLVVLLLSLTLVGCTGQTQVASSTSPSSPSPAVEAPAAPTVTPSSQQPPAGVSAGGTPIPSPTPAAPITSAASPSSTAQPTAAPADANPSAPETAPPIAVSPESPGARFPAVAAPPLSGGYRLLIPAIGVDAQVVDVGIDPDGAMAAPNGPDIVGWFAAGARPGGAGNVLMDGHVDWADRTTGVARTAVFWRLKEVGVGQELAVVAGERRYVYQVRESLQFAWDDPSAVRVLAPTSQARLTLITCEGGFDAGSHNYSHRRVIVAELSRTE